MNNKLVTEMPNKSNKPHCDQIYLDQLLSYSQKILMINIFSLSENHCLRMPPSAHSNSVEPQTARHQLTGDKTLISSVRDTVGWLSGYGIFFAVARNVIQYKVLACLASAFTTATVQPMPCKRNLVGNADLTYTFRAKIPH